jgi:hypothetical protein
MIEDSGYCSIARQSQPMVEMMRDIRSRDAKRQANLDSCLCPIWKPGWRSTTIRTAMICWDLWRRKHPPRDRIATSSPLEEIKKPRPQVVLLPSEPYPFETEALHPSQASRTPRLTWQPFYCIDGMALCWYGHACGRTQTALSPLPMSSRRSMNRKARKKGKRLKAKRKARSLILFFCPYLFLLLPFHGSSIAARILTVDGHHGYSRRRPQKSAATES